MARPYDIITFDCYGTLIDWETGLFEAFQTAAQEDGVPLAKEELLATYARFEIEVENEGYRSYRDVLAETTARVATHLGWALSPPRTTLVVDSLPTWTPFPDTNPALERLASAGYWLGILSNVDDDLLASTRRHLSVDFEILVTAQRVRAYKPAHDHFETARDRIGKRRWLHAAQSSFHDIVPARSLRIPAAWINRHHRQALAGGEATRELGSLAELADWLT
jgi:2-haloacid dehalogenase/putative hydrolase of the HAD superfamily